jgi:hypothetical protein
MRVPKIVKMVLTPCFGFGGSFEARSVLRPGLTENPCFFVIPQQHQVSSSEQAHVKPQWLKAK